MRLGEHVVPVDLAKNLLADFRGHAALPRLFQKALAVRGDEVPVVRLGEGAADFIGLGGAHARHVHDEHHLLLPHDDAVAALQGALLQRVVIVPRGAVAVALDEVGHRTALGADAGADEGDLVGQVQQVARPQALAHLELRRRLQQEDALAAARVDQVVNLGILRVDAAEVRAPSLLRLDQVQGFFQLIQHRQGQQIDLGKMGVCHAVFVPVHDETPRRGTGAHGHHVGDRRAAQHHAADVLAEQPGGAHELRRKPQQVAPAGGVHAVAEGVEPQHFPAQSLPRTPDQVRGRL